MQHERTLCLKSSFYVSYVNTLWLENFHLMSISKSIERKGYENW